MIKEPHIQGKGGKALVMVVDDHPLVRQGLTSLINRQPDMEVCGEADDPHGALAAAARHAPRLAIVDLSLGAADGLDLVKDLKARHQKMDILVLSMHDETFYAERALRAGASGYVMKQERLGVVVDAARRIIGGQIYLSEKMTARLMRRIAGRGAEQAATPAESLSDRELQVLHLMGRGLGVSEIAQRLHISPKTVETHRSRLKERLNLDSARALRQYAIQWAKENGSV